MLSLRRLPVTTCDSSHSRDDVGRVLELVRSFRAVAEESGQLARNRSEQELKLLLSAVQGELAFRLRTDERISALVREQHRRIVCGEVAPRVAAEALCERFVERMRAP